ncbi:MAG TPA: type IV pilus assembly protein PilM [Planctomycetaceae bacterium]|jgi:type IV pilus assembly protein PilM|nr:type IV pilus assembly protein PilM [Planctomycetaceae bacterium]
MAGKPGAWGVDIGQAGLKAIRLEISDATEQVVATAFDYIAHPKILSQPDAIPEELISQALDKFLKQNEIENDLLAISVPGQSALARFIQLPPVEASKVSEIVKYEARQQIPFALEDVVWDYQTLGKGTEESGFLLEAEVGLFAMKRDQVNNQLRPFTNAQLEVELIQIAPLALYNFLSFDQLGIRLGDDTVAMDSYTILLDMGADNTTLLVSNGQKIWIRNVPIGGNHFTRALTKEMKLTFAKAEHLKCNATKSPDPRSVFQALRPVFNDYVSEIQRSIGYFSSVNREAKISKVVGLGNGFKLAGLQKFLQQNLQYEVERVDSFDGITTDSFKDAALFEENILSFPVCYGVALQALKQTRIRTSLLPKEITTARTIARKKPWAVAAAAVLLTGVAASAFGYARVYQSVGDRFKPAESKITEVNNAATKAKSEYQATRGANTTKNGEADSLLEGSVGRNYWLELYKAVDECLPDDKQETEDVRKQNRVRIFSLQARWQPDLADWYNKLNQNAKGYLDESEKKAPPVGAGFVVTLRGEHMHDETLGTTRDEKHPEIEISGRGPGWLYDHFVRQLQQWVVPSHDGSGEVGVRKIGISYATIASCPTPSKIREDPLGRITSQPGTRSGGPNWGNGSRRDKKGKGRGGYGMGMRGPGGGGDEGGENPGLGFDIRTGAALQSGEADAKTPKAVDMEVNHFVVEFVWRPELRPPAPPAAPAAPVAAPGSAAPASKAAVPSSSPTVKK